MTDKNTNISQRILQLIECEGVGKSGFSLEIGKSAAFIRKVIDNNREISTDVLKSILKKFPNVRWEWLVFNRGDMLHDSSKKPSEKPLHPQVETPLTKEPNNSSIPLLPAEAIAGMSDGSVSIREEDIQEFYTIPDFADVDFMIRVKGSSMYPKYNSGDIIACRFLEGSRFIQWNKVYVIATQYQGVLVKRLKPSDNEDCFTAISDNEKYDPFDIPKSEITNIALVIGVIRLE